MTMPHWNWLSSNSGRARSSGNRFCFSSDRGRRLLRVAVPALEALLEVLFGEVAVGGNADLRAVIVRTRLRVVADAMSVPDVLLVLGVSDLRDDLAALGDDAVFLRRHQVRASGRSSRACSWRPCAGRSTCGPGRRSCRRRPARGRSASRRTARTPARSRSRPVPAARTPGIVEVAVPFTVSFTRSLCFSLNAVGRLRADDRGVVPDQLRDRVGQLLQPRVHREPAVEHRVVRVEGDFERVLRRGGRWLIRTDRLGDFRGLHFDDLAATSDLSRRLSFDPGLAGIRVACSG